MPNGYWIAQVDVHDSERYKDYIATARPAFERFGARFLVRGGKVTNFEGANRARNVVIEFPSVESALECYNSAEYQAAKAIRVEVSEAQMMVIEGYSE